MKSIQFCALLLDDIILRLCKFRDEDTRSLSFDQVFKALRKRADSGPRVDGVEEDIKAYRELTKNLEAHRVTRVAHLAKRGRAHLKPTVEILDAIVQALKITDTFSGGRNSYHVVDIDVRADVEP